MLPSTEKVFVYGTLRPPRNGTALLDSRFFPEIESEIVSSELARVSGLALYDMGAYPAAVYSDETVIGDLLTVTPEALATMDRIEGHPDFYQRVKVRALGISETVDAWMYYAPAALIVGYPRIRSGDWFDRQELEEPYTDPQKLDHRLK